KELGIGLPCNSIFMGRGAPWEHESSVASFRLRRFVVWSLLPTHAAKEESDDGDQLQRGHFPPGIILMGVRLYVAFPLSTRHVEELMLERGVHVDHSTINRWVVKYSPQLEEAFHRRKRPVWISWRMDEGFVAIFISIILPKARMR